MSLYFSRTTRRRSFIVGPTGALGDVSGARRGAGELQTPPVPWLPRSWTRVEPASETRRPAGAHARTGVGLCGHQDMEEAS